MDISSSSQSGGNQDKMLLHRGWTAKTLPTPLLPRAPARNHFGIRPHMRMGVDTRVQLKSLRVKAFGLVRKDSVIHYSTCINWYSIHTLQDCSTSVVTPE